MALVGLEKIHYAPIRLNEQKKEVYGKPKALAKAIQAEITINAEKQTLYADNKPAIVVNQFGGGEIKLTVDDLPPEALADLIGAELSQDKKLLANSVSQVPNPVAIGFVANKAGGINKYVWLKKVQFSLPQESYQTMGEKIEFKVPELVGAILTDEDGRWKIEHETAGQSDQATGWFENVPTFTTGG